MNIVAFGVAMPLTQFIAEVGWTFLFFPMWPLLAVASVVQLAILRRSGVLGDRRAWKVGFAVLLTPFVAVLVRLGFYISGVPDWNPLPRWEPTSLYALTLTSSAVLSTLLAYGFSTWLAVLGREREV